MPITVQDVCELVTAKLGGRAGHALSGDTVLRDVGLSSLEIVDVVYTIEDRLGVEFDPARAADITTIADLVELANSTALANTEP